MGKFGDTQKRTEETKKLQFSRKERLSNYFYDLSKLSFGGVAVGSGIAWVNDQKVAFLIMLVVGIYLTAIFAYMANELLVRHIKSL